MSVSSIAEEILNVFLSRKGFDNWWYNIEEEFHEEMKKEIIEIIRREYQIETIYENLRVSRVEET